jgi:predicted TIM-barrel fold metal-dependent hydrolase
MRKIDVHGHYGNWNFPIPGTNHVENLLALCERHDIAHVACSSVLSLCYSMEEGNAEIAAAFAGHAQLLAYVYVNANFLPESVAEMERYLPEGNFVGCKIHASYSGVNNADPKMQDLVAEIARRARVLKIHSGGPDVPGVLARWAELYPHLNIIIAHAFGNDTEGAARLARRHRNLYLEFCSSWAGAGKIARAVDICGVEQVLLGTDVDLIDPAFVIGQYEAAGLSDAQLQAIYWDNPRRVLGLAPES